MLRDLVSIMNTALAGVAGARRLLAWLEPARPAADLVAPLVAVASVLVLALLSGLAVGALATLIVALFALYVLLTEVFGLSVELAHA